MFLQKDSLTKSEELEQILKDIEQIGDIQASTIVSKNGLMMVSNCIESVDANTIGAMVAMLIRSATHVVKELEKEDLEYLLIHTRSGEILVMNVCSNAILCVMTNKYEKAGLTLVEMKKAGKKIKNILGE
ncbi:MAG: roadblock/LC7 domain-containing protein [ANME-2 cluster archaeon]|nr:roadblock/LC7 domain-containing protein [ANME-2 cluster archaeon]